MEGQLDLTGREAPTPERMIGDVPISEIPREAYRLVFEGDPFPMPRVKGRIAGKPPNQFVSIYTPPGAPKGDETCQARQKSLALEWTAARFPTFPAGVPVAVDVLYVFARPATHFGTGRNRHVLKPKFEHTRPGHGAKRDGRGRRLGGDVDNLDKLVLDALSGHAFADDADVARCHSEKLYLDQAEDGGVEPRTIVSVRALIPRP